MRNGNPHGRHGAALLQGFSAKFLALRTLVRNYTFVQ